MMASFNKSSTYNGHCGVHPLLIVEDCSLLVGEEEAKCLRSSMISGEKEKLKELLRSRLIECGWRDQVKLHAKEIVKSRGLEKVKLESLVKEITPRGRKPLSQVEMDSEEVPLDLLHIELVAHFVSQKDKIDEALSTLEAIDELDLMKFICKDFWVSVFRKQIDNLRTNHQGVYVLQDNTFKFLNKISDGKQYLEFAPRYMAFTCGLLRGTLANLGIVSVVTADVTSMPSVKFQQRRIMDDAARQRRARKALEKLEYDNFNEDPHADLVMSKKAMNLFQDDDEDPKKSVKRKTQPRHLLQPKHPGVFVPFVGIFINTLVVLVVHIIVQFVAKKLIGKRACPYGFQAGCLPIILRQNGLSFANLGAIKLLFLPWIYSVDIQKHLT
ncbi:TRAPPC6 [Lepeophtheirus salmonis]|uniref:Transcription and mRNA export factor ENY2 n=1 Tax=Lepeophtheirus salmonis TaxID=72036 RepID=A0A7R8CQV9_LEPSM|nr:TRAPPC6 [Lepeophtheirus salmonis]CAF2865392.1 TRAPPC6 [Lepeophtheirus salmonis]